MFFHQERKKKSDIFPANGKSRTTFSLSLFLIETCRFATFTEASHYFAITHRHYPQPQGLPSHQQQLLLSLLYSKDCPETSFVDNNSRSATFTTVATRQQDFKLLTMATNDLSLIFWKRLSSDGLRKKTTTTT